MYFLTGFGLETVRYELYSVTRLCMSNLRIIIARKIKIKNKTDKLRVWEITRTDKVQFIELCKKLSVIEEFDKYNLFAYYIYF